MSDCLFCKIIRGDMPASKVYEDDHVIAFDDINPQAPVHVLIVPKKHIATLNDIDNEPDHVVESVFNAARIIAREKGIAESGYRIVANCNENAGQTVFHIHFHLLGGRPLAWPPG